MLVAPRRPRPRGRRQCEHSAAQARHQIAGQPRLPRAQAHSATREQCSDCLCTWLCILGCVCPACRGAPVKAPAREAGAEAEETAQGRGAVNPPASETDAIEDAEGRAADLACGTALPKDLSLVFAAATDDVVIVSDEQLGATFC